MAIEVIAEPIPAKQVPQHVGSREILPLSSTQVLEMLRLGILPEDSRFELIDGVLYRMTRGELHNSIVDVLGEKLRALVPPGVRVREEKSTTADDLSLPEPDLFLFRGGPWDFLPNPAPLDRVLLAVEVNVNSPWDHVQKHAKYAAGGVPFYWVVDAEPRRVVVYDGPSRDGYDRSATFRPGDHLELVIEGEVRGRIAVADLFPPEPAPRS